MKESLSKDDIKKAFLLWEKSFREEPGDYMSDEEQLKLTVEELAEMDVETLLGFHKKARK